MENTFIDGMRIEIARSSTPTPVALRKELMRDAAFGTLFTDHMVTMRWTTDRGWHDAKVGPREPLRLDPASSVLHYAQEIFEGMKAYRLPDDSVALFRPEENARRFSASAERLAMPTMEEDIFVGAVRALIDIDRAWIPRDAGSLYLRPFMFASEAFLGVRSAREYTFCVIACPVGDYFKGGARPLKLWVTEEYTRAGQGGTGAAKCGGNYASSLLAQAEASQHDCDQVVFLDAAERRWVEELGGMNLFFVAEGKAIFTPPLTGTILPGITRSSLITLARDAGLAVAERHYSLEEWRMDAVSGRLREVFACGTAAVVAEIAEVHSNSGQFAIGDGGVGEITCSLRRQLVGIQRGELPDKHGWRHIV